MSDPSTPRRRRAQRDASFSASDFPAENELSSVLPPEDGAPAEATGIYTIGQPTDNPAFFPEEEVDWGTDPFVLDDADHEKHSLFRPAVKSPTLCSPSSSV